jgi:hypothetical protein
LFFNENVVSFRLMMQRYIKKIYRARKTGEILSFFAIFFVFHIHMPLKCVVIVMMCRDIAPARTGEIDEDWF